MDIDTEGMLHLDIASFVGKSTALLGITGSGKTNTAAVLIEELLSNGLPLTIVEEESYEFLSEYFTRLWEIAGKERKPYQIVLEEAHEFIPQGTTTPLKQMLTRIALRGRKRGLGMILMSQRSAKVEKDVLTQTSLLFLHKVVHPTDMRVYKDVDATRTTGAHEISCSASGEL